MVRDHETASSTLATLTTCPVIRDRKAGGSNPLTPTTFPIALEYQIGVYLGRPRIPTRSTIDNGPKVAMPREGLAMEPVAPLTRAQRLSSKTSWEPKARDERVSPIERWAINV